MFINIINYNEQFYLFLIRKNHRQKFIIIFYRELKHYNVAFIEFKGLILYIQKKMNDFLHLYKHFVKCYIDDVVIFFKTIKKYFEHLRIIFRLFV